MKDIGKIMRSLRIERNMTQDKLAEKIGVTKQTISNYERGSRRPDYEELEAICDVMNVPMSFFLTDEERKKELQDAYAREGVLARIVPGNDEIKKTALDKIIDQLTEYRDAMPYGLRPDEERLLNDYRMLNTKQRVKLRKLIEVMLDDE